MKPIEIFNERQKDNRLKMMILGLMMLIFFVAPVLLPRNPYFVFFYGGLLFSYLAAWITYFILTGIKLNRVEKSEINGYRTNLFDFATQYGSYVIDQNNLYFQTMDGYKELVYDFVNCSNPIKVSVLPGGGLREDKLFFKTEGRIYTLFVKVWNELYIDFVEFEPEVENATFSAEKEMIQRPHYTFFRSAWQLILLAGLNAWINLYRGNTEIGAIYLGILLVSYGFFFLMRHRRIQVLAGKRVAKERKNSLASLISQMAIKGLK